MRDASSGQRTVMDSAEAETVIGPGRTPEMSAGTVAATLIEWESGRPEIAFDSTPGLHLIPAARWTALWILRHGGLAGGQCKGLENPCRGVAARASLRKPGRTSCEQNPCLRQCS